MLDVPGPGLEPRGPARSSALTSPSRSAAPPARPQPGRVADRAGSPRPPGVPRSPSGAAAPPVARGHRRLRHLRRRGAGRAAAGREAVRPGRPQGRAAARPGCGRGQLAGVPDPAQPARPVRRAAPVGRVGGSVHRGGDRDDRRPGSGRRPRPSKPARCSGERARARPGTGAGRGPRRRCPAPAGAAVPGTHRAGRPRRRRGRGRARAGGASSWPGAMAGAAAGRAGRGALHIRPGRGRRVRRLRRARVLHGGVTAVRGTGPARAPPPRHRVGGVHAAGQFRSRSAALRAAAGADVAARRVPRTRRRCRGGRGRAGHCAAPRCWSSVRWSPGWGRVRASARVCRR
jgi:hypothetical protein